MDEKLNHTNTILSALSEKLYIINGRTITGSFVKMVKQIIVGVHISFAVETMVFRAKSDPELRDPNSWPGLDI